LGLLLSQDFLLPRDFLLPQDFRLCHRGPELSPSINKQGYCQSPKEWAPSTVQPEPWYFANTYG
jgi:hypothetical protein